MAQIFEDKGFQHDAIRMHEKALNHKLKILPQYDSEIINSY